VVFTRQLATMIDAGLAMVQCLQGLADQTTNKIMRDVIHDVCTRVEGGDSFSMALTKHPKVFTRLYVSMVDAGEKGGLLAEVLARLATYLENTARLRKKVKSAMMYPTAVTVIAIAITTFLLVRVVPVFGEMFADFGAKLPAPTQALLNFSSFLKKYGFYMIAVIAMLVFFFKRWKATPAGAFAFDEILLKAPVFGELRKKVASARFARTFGQLIRSGVPILQSLEIVSGATGSVVAGSIITNAAKAVENGEPLSSAMIKQTVFPLLLVRMLQAGEKTGKIDEMMDSIADFYDDEVETMLSGLTSLLEPLLMVFLGVIIGGIVMCMFLPIFKMGEIVSG